MAAECVEAKIILLMRGALQIVRNVWCMCTQNDCTHKMGTGKKIEGLYKLQESRSVWVVWTRTVWFKLKLYLNAVFFLSLSHMCTSVFEVMSVYPLDWYQNPIPRAMPLHELKKVQLQEHFTLMTHDSVDHLKILCVSVLSLSGGIESEWKATAHRALSIEKMPSFHMNPAFMRETDSHNWMSQESIQKWFLLFQWNLKSCLWLPQWK